VFVAAVIAVVPALVIVGTVVMIIVGRMVTRTVAAPAAATR
jgi:hypothetical protein